MLCDNTYVMCAEEVCSMLIETDQRHNYIEHSYICAETIWAVATQAVLHVETDQGVAVDLVPAKVIGVRLESLVRSQPLRDLLCYGSYTRGRYGHGPMWLWPAQPSCSICVTCSPTQHVVVA